MFIFMCRKNLKNCEKNKYLVFRFFSFLFPFSFIFLQPLPSLVCSCNVLHKNCPLKWLKTISTIFVTTSENTLKNLYYVCIINRFVSYAVAVPVINSTAKLTLEFLNLPRIKSLLIYIFQRVCFSITCHFKHFNSPLC